jgi:hypothetical protein
VEVARVDAIVVDDADPARAPRGERERCRASEPARADDENARFHGYSK